MANAVPAAGVEVAAAVGVGGVVAVETDAAAYGTESGAAETVVQLTSCSWLDFGSKIADLIQKMEESSSLVHHLQDSAL